MKNYILIFTILFFTKSLSASEPISISVNLNLESQVTILKQKNDSLSKRLDQIEKNDYKSISVIEKVNDFYDKAWNRLIIFFSIAGSIILFVLPYLLSKNQEEKINLKTKEFDDLTTKKVNELVLKIAQFHNDQFELLKKEIGLTQSDLRQNITEETTFLQGYIFALRGMISEKDKNYNLFFKHYIIATNKFISINETNEIESMVRAITQRIKTCVNKEIEVNNETQTRLNKLIEILEKDYIEVFPDTIEELKDNKGKLTVK
jgi:hypothetical protein